MNGKELRDRIAHIRPGIKTLFMSGYTANVIVQHGVLDEGVHFIQKPFSMGTLARKIRNALK
jgi:FixJ family two-component response regulator